MVWDRSRPSGPRRLSALRMLRVGLSLAAVVALSHSAASQQGTFPPSIEVAPNTIEFIPPSRKP
jgi:hypothetical protein